MKRIIYSSIAIQLALLGTVFGEGQLTSAVETILLEAGVGYGRAVFGQKAQTNRLVLLPDSCFYNPKGPEVAGWIDDTTTPGSEFNGDEVSTTPISNIKNIGQKILWPIMPASTGTVSMDFYIEADALMAGADVVVRIGDSYSNQFTVAESDGLSPQPWNITAASITAAGVSTSAVQYVEFELVDLNGKSEAGYIHQIKLTGTPLNNGYLVRSRWRPPAVHCNYESSGLNASGLDAKMWVMECKPDFPASENHMGFYAPFTTGFGYFGSSFEPAEETPENDFTASRPNFSMWSWGSSESEPPLLEQSHLLSLGQPLDEFGSFTHEGSGVKPEDNISPQAPDLFPGPRTSHVLALRYEPDDLQGSYKYKTYESYYYDNDTTEWKFYASGRKYKSGLNADNNVLQLPGSFVEVPGGRSAQRTGQIPRTSDVRGWVQDTSGTWHQIDIISSGGPSTSDPVSKIWESVGNGWHRMSMGGIIHRLYDVDDLSLTNTYSGSLPTYMDSGKLTVLDAEPCRVEVNSVVVQSNGTMDIDFTLTGVDTNTEVKVYYGDDDALTLFQEADKWDHFESLGSFASGNHQLTIPASELPGLPGGGYCRILAECSKGRYWSRETSQWDNLGPDDPLPGLPLYTDFEEGFGGWVTTSGPNIYPWKRFANSTPTPSTGPSSGASNSAYFVYMETSSGSAYSSGDSAILESPEISSGMGRIMSFFYHMYGADIGTLNVDVYAGGAWANGVWSLSGEQHSSSADPYTQAEVDLSDFSGTIKVRFRAVAEGGYWGDIAIDEITIISSDDFDVDGMNDDWEELYFTNGIAALPDGNPDGDKHNNLQEYIAGMDPTNAASVFSVVDAEMEEGVGFVITWTNSVSERWYRINWTPSLTNSFTNIADFIEYPQNSHTDTLHQAGNQGFYQVEVRLKGEPGDEPVPPTDSLEDFSYADGSPVDGLAGGDGWAGAWSGGDFTVTNNQAIATGASISTRAFASGATTIGTNDTVTVTFDLIRAERQSGRGIGIQLLNAETVEFFIGKRVNGPVGLHSAVNGTTYTEFASNLDPLETIVATITYDGASTSIQLADSDETLAAYTFAGQLTFDGIGIQSRHSSTLSNGIDNIHISK